ncbi:hypothetical protein KUCAC02_021984 [Chaenocephalus aceratus]|nr:hypothetical protein KUCAC02_021984 [Chaenocephalus aceratus]
MSAGGQEERVEVLETSSGEPTAMDRGLRTVCSVWRPRESGVLVPEARPSATPLPAIYSELGLNVFFRFDRFMHCDVAERDVECTSAACVGGGGAVTDWGMWPLSSTAWRSTCGIRTVHQPDAIHSRRQGLYFNPDLDVLVGSR